MPPIPLLALGLGLSLGLTATAATAECLTANSIDKGVVFKRQTGDVGFVVRKGNAVHIDYVTNRPSVQDERVAAFGIYETQHDYYPWGPDMVGAGTVSTETTYAKRGPEPAPGLAYQTGWRTKVTDHAPVENGPIVTRGKGTVTFLYQEVKEVKLSGCTYRAMGVEATIQSPDGWTKQRWVYFTDLGFGLETRVTTATDDYKRGLVELRAPK